MSFVSNWLGKVPGLRGRGRAQSPLCPFCRSFLDAPGVNPVTGSRARKCFPCSEWHAVGATRAPDRSE